EDRRMAGLTLGRIGEPAQPAVPVFRELLHESGPDAQETCLWSLKALARMGQPAETAAEDVARIAGDDRQPYLIRATAMEALARIGGRQPVAPATLIQILQVDHG